MVFLTQVEAWNGKTWYVYASLSFDSVLSWFTTQQENQSWKTTFFSEWIGFPRCVGFFNCGFAGTFLSPSRGVPFSPQVSLSFLFSQTSKSHSVLHGRRRNPDMGWEFMRISATGTRSTCWRITLVALNRQDDVTRRDQYSHREVDNLMTSLQ